MNIEYREGLLFTDIEILYKGKTKIINNIVVDTGASRTLISQDIVDDIGIKVSRDDEVVTSYGIGGKEHAFVKIIDKIKLGEFSLDNCSLDFTSFQYDDINGLLGLDLLLEAGFIIDLSKLRMYL
ncbi:retropepsin-like aspartic protease [Herbivorax sp. ANBcel31]|uniref:retropepsin-like aspartic protease n=1 Tax=Herbivorax sp. ANBcel31 TaxID=3069754 RepID=UPI0027B250F5|nr:retropepsin-like aspartic protease [Herbivorax sp. ANBcel31]MDQ2087959.1 retropepsin-like aspartic protease [Herbivorax sp. ANBcel31]